MSDLKIERPEDAKEIAIEGATVPFYEYKVGDTTYVEFDTSRCGPPEPMVNAMLALKLIREGKADKAIMINHKKPMGLLPKIEGEFDIEAEEEANGIAKLIFSKKVNPTKETDFSNNTCGGGSC